MKKKMHAIAGAVALLTISTFWVSTLLSEGFGNEAQIAMVKNAVLWGMLLLIPAMAMTGASGFSLGAKWKSPIINKKRFRMKVVAANGILILLPSAFFLAGRASAANFDFSFYAIQAVEILAGATNITLLSLNMRDGLALRRRGKN